MEERAKFVDFNGYRFRLSGSYYRKNCWSQAGPSNLHRAIWEQVNGPIPEGFHVHHRDGDTFNNCIDNLTIIEGRQHVRQHAIAATASGKLKPHPISPENEQQNGTEARKEEPPIERSLTTVGSIMNGMKSIAITAFQLCHLGRLSLRVPSGARYPVKLEVVTLPKESSVPVYDLTVENHACYRANGILVSNSDALRTMATAIREPPQAPKRVKRPMPRATSGSWMA